MKRTGWEGSPCAQDSLGIRKPGCVPRWTGRTANLVVFPSLIFKFPFIHKFPKAPWDIPRPAERPEPTLTLAPSFFSPREPHTTVLFSPWAQVLEVAEPSHARNSVPQCLEERVSPGGLFTSLSSLALQNPHPRTGAAPRLWATQPLCPAGPLSARRLRYARARMGRRRRLRLGQLGPDKLGTSGSAGTSPSPSGCASSPEPRRSTWPWASAGSSWSAPWSRGLCSPVGRRASTWVRGRQGTGWQGQEASRRGRTGTWGSGRRTGFRTRNRGSPELTINGLFNSGPVPTSDPVSVLQSLRMTQDMLRMGTNPTSFHPFHC